MADTAGRIEKASQKGHELADKFGVALEPLAKLLGWEGRFSRGFTGSWPLGPFWVCLVFRRVGFVETSRFGAIFGKVLPCLFPGERLMAAERVVPTARCRGRSASNLIASRQEASSAVLSGC